MAFNLTFLSLSIGNFLSIRRLSYGQTSSRSTYFWLRQSRFLPLPATSGGHKAIETPPSPPPLLISRMLNLWWVWHRELGSCDINLHFQGVRFRLHRCSATSTCSVQGVCSGGGSGGIRIRKMQHSVGKTIPLHYGSTPSASCCVPWWSLQTNPIGIALYPTVQHGRGPEVWSGTVVLARSIHLGSYWHSIFNVNPACCLLLSCCCRIWLCSHCGWHCALHHCDGLRLNSWF